MTERRVTTGSPNPPRTFADEALAGAEVMSGAPDCERCATDGSLGLGLWLGLELELWLELGLGLWLWLRRELELGL